MKIRNKVSGKVYEVSEGTLYAKNAYDIVTESDTKTTSEEKPKKVDKSKAKK